MDVGSCFLQPGAEGTKECRTQMELLGVYLPLTPLCWVVRAMREVLSGKPGVFGDGSSGRCPSWEQV